MIKTSSVNQAVIEQRTKHDMAKTPKPILKILKVTEYKGYHVLIQHFFKTNIFQVVLFKDGQFYQAADKLSPTEKGAKYHSDDDLVKAAVLYLDTATLIADKIDEANDKLNAPSGKDISQMN